jgi:hypothetical protein
MLTCRRDNRVHAAKLVYHLSERILHRLFRRNVTLDPNDFQTISFNVAARLTAVYWLKSLEEESRLPHEDEMSSLAASTASASFKSKIASEVHPLHRYSGFVRWDKTGIVTIG